MSFSNTSLINKLHTAASEGTLNFRLASCFLNGKKQVGKICINNPQTFCRGKFSTSCHAEATTILRRYGKSLRYSDSHGWCLLRDSKGTKGQQT